MVGIHKGAPGSNLGTTTYYWLAWLISTMMAMGPVQWDAPEGGVYPFLIPVLDAFLLL